MARLRRECKWECNDAMTTWKGCKSMLMNLKWDRKLGVPVHRVLEASQVDGGRSTARAHDH